MPLDTDTLEDLSTQLDAIEARLVAAASYGGRRIGTPGPVLECLDLIRRLESQLAAIEAVDPEAHFLLASRLETVWAAYVRATDLSGLGVAASYLSRGRNM